MRGPKPGSATMVRRGWDVTGADPYPWRDAATVIPWVRRPDGGRLVLMVERPVRQPGWPGFWVFPGGGVSAADRDAAPPHAGQSEEELTRAMMGVEVSAHGVNQDRFMEWAAPRFMAQLGHVPSDRWPAGDRDLVGNRAAWRAAARELFEETGLLLREGLGIPPVSRGSRDAVRFQAGALAAGALRYHGRLATPPHERLRFDCRFFSVEATVAPWPAATPPPREVECLRWVTPSEALATDRLALPTRHVLERLDELLDAEEAFGTGAVSGGFRKVEKQNSDGD